MGDPVVIPYYRPFKLPRSEQKQLSNKISEIIESGNLTNSENVRQLEGAIKKRYHVDYVAACSSATAGLWITLKVLTTASIEVQAFTWSSVLHALPSGIEPLYVDIDPETWLMQPRWNGAAIIATHTLGNIFELRKENYDGTVIYDAAKSFGAKIRDFGDATVFSFAPTKGVTSAEGGAMATNHLPTFNEIVARRDLCSRMSEVHAAIGLVYMKHTDEIMERRRSIADYYKKHLPFTFQEEASDHTYESIGCLTGDWDRDAIAKRLLEKGIETRVYYRPLSTRLKTTNEIYSQILCLPCGPSTNERKVVDTIKKILW